MAVQGPSGAIKPKAVIFDLDEALLDRRRAWQYAVEEAVAVVSGRRISAEPLVEEYRRRPWSHSLGVILENGQERARAAELCRQMFERSSLKRLLVQEGTGMALDQLRGEGIEVGAISRERHALAIKQVHSTGLDRFIAVLATTPEGSPWEIADRMSQCLRFLERAPEEVAFVSGDGDDLRAAEAAGVRPFEAQWVAVEESAYPRIESPGAVVGALIAAWRRR